MAVNYGVPYGPAGRPGYMVNSVFFFDDFIGTSLSATDDAAVWDNTSDSGSTVVIAVDEPNGVLTLTANEIGLDASVELNGEPFQFLRGQDMLFECRWKVSSIATNTAEVFVGLSQTGIDLVSGTTGGIETNAVGFMTYGDVNIQSFSADGTSQTVKDTTDNLVADTYVVTTWKYQATSETIRFYVDGVHRTTHKVGDSEIMPADATNLTIILTSEQHVGSSTLDLDIDYVLFAMDRA